MRITIGGLLFYQFRSLASVIAIAVMICAVFVAPGALAADLAGKTTASLDVWTMAMTLLGGLALFLFGMEQMADALKALAADHLKTILARLTTNRYMGALTGAIVTAIIQSSSVTTVLTVGFITAGILSVSQAIGIIFGANIGTTLTAQIVAFKVTKLALLMIAAGFGMLFTSSKDQVKQYGALIMGLGMVFYGMSVMSGAMKPLRSYQPFLDLMIQMQNPALAILVAAAFTGLVQSSSATTGVVIAMAGQGLITLDAGIALIFGANVGTCVTAMLASIGKPRNAIRASLAHVMFNILGVVLWVWFIDPLARAVVSLSPVAGDLTGLEKLAAETPRQIANAHTIFNVANTLIFLPFGGQFARLVEYLTPDRGEDAVVSRGVDEEWTKLHLDPDLLPVPSIALEQTRGEILRRSRMVGEMIDEIIPAFIENDSESGDRILRKEEEISYVGEQINEFLIQISRRNLHRSQSEFTMQLMDINTDLDHICSLMKKDLVPLLLKKSEESVDFSEEGKESLRKYHGLVSGCYKKAVMAFDQHDVIPAREVVRAKPELDGQQREARIAHFSRIRDEREESVGSDEIHISLVDYVRRIFSYSESIALTMLEGYMDTREKSRRDMREAYASSK